MVFDGWCVVQVTLETIIMVRDIRWSHSAYECATTYSSIMAFIEKWKYMWVVNWLYIFAVAFFICRWLTKLKVVCARLAYFAVCSEISTTQFTQLWATTTTTTILRLSWFCPELPGKPAHTHTHTDTTILLLFWSMSGTTQVSRYQKGKTRKVKTNLDLLEQEILSIIWKSWSFNSELNMTV